jgi:hypothetical protein
VLKIVFLIYASWVKRKIRKPSGGNQGAFSNQKPLTIKPYSMKIRGEYRR